MLYERYGQAIFGYLRLHAHSLEDAEDLLLEVFLAALERDNLYRQASTNVRTTNGHLAIWVELPHFGGNEQQTIATLLQTGHLEFWGTGPFPVHLNTTFEPASYAQYNPGGRPRFTGRDLDPNSLSVSYDQAGRPQIDFEMQGSSIDACGSFTAHNIGEYLTITFDREVIESAVIESTITGHTVITGNFTQQQANAAVADLKAGSLLVALTVAAG